MARRLLGFLLVVVAIAAPLNAQQSTENVNVMPVWVPCDPLADPNCGSDPAWANAWRYGDIYLQRQVEGSLAPSSMNPDRILTAFIDYSAVETFGDTALGDTVAQNAWQRAVGALAKLLHLRRSEPSAHRQLQTPASYAGVEAWIRLTWSTNSGATATPFFMPGAPWDLSPAAQTAPYYQIADGSSDPVVVAGPNGDFHVIFMAFKRGEVNWIVDGRFRDLNIPDEPARHGLTFLGFTPLASGNNATWGTLHDKPHALTVLNPASPAGYDLYVSYTLFNGNPGGSKFQSQLFVARSTDGGVSFTTDKVNQSTNENSGTWLVARPDGQVFTFWRGFGSASTIYFVKRTSGGWTKAQSILGKTPLAAFDQPNIKVNAANLVGSEQSITPRSNAFPSAAVGSDGTIFVVFQECVSTATGAPLACAMGGSPRIMLTFSKDAGVTWSPRKAFDVGVRPPEPDGLGYFWNVGRSDNGAHPQMMPSIACAVGRCLVTYWESRTADLTAGGYIGGYHRLVDLRGASLKLDDGTVAGRGFQISRYPYRPGTRLVDPTAVGGDGKPLPRAENVNDVARVNEIVNPDGTHSCVGPPGVEPPLAGLEPGCIPRLNFYCRPQSGAGTTCFMGDYNSVVPSTSFIRSAGTWKVPVSPAEVPYVGFLTFASDNRNLVPPSAVLPSKGGLAPNDQLSQYTAWTPGNHGLPSCTVGGSRNTDMLLAKVDFGLVVTTPVTSKTAPSPGDAPFLVFPLQVWNNTGAQKTVTFTIDPAGTTSTGSFSKTSAIKSGTVVINAYSSTTREVYATDTSPVAVQVSDGSMTTSVTFNGTLVAGSPATPSSIVVSDPVNISAENISAENISAENISAENISAENISAENISAENISAENLGIQETSWVIQATGDPTRAYAALAAVDKAYSDDYDFHVVIYRLSSVGACVDTNGRMSLQYQATVVANTGAVNISAENISAENISAENISAENGFPADATNILNNSIFTPKPSPGASPTNRAAAASIPPGGYIVGEGVEAQPPEQEFTVVKLLAIPKKPLDQIGSIYDATTNPASLVVSPYWCDQDCAPVRKGSDLVVGAAPALTPATAGPGEPVTVDSYTVPNTGTLAAGPRRYGYYLSSDSVLDLLPSGLVDQSKDVLLGEITFTTSLLPSPDGGADVLAPQTLTIPAGTPLGAAYLFLYADDLREVSELDEGNNITPAATLTIADTTPPAITAHADVTAEATGPSGATVSYTNPAAIDNVDGPVGTVCVPASGSPFPLGNTTVRCTAIDTAGNQSSTTFVVAVVDTTPPVIANAPSGITREATGPNGATVSWTAPTANDSVDGTVTVTCTPLSGSTFAVGDTTVTCTATDAHGNQAVPAVFVVHVVDTTPPVLTVPSAIVVPATSLAGAIVTFTASAYDIVSGAVAVSCTPSSGSLFPIGTTAVNCTATDGRGNTAVKSFNVTVALHYGFTPVQNLPPPGGRTFNPGSSVPLKWQFTIGGVAVDSSGAKPIITIVGPSGSESFSPNDPGSSWFQPPTAANGWTWQFNWQTPNVGGTYTVTIASRLTGDSFSGGQITLKP